jgi:hypothetical protein
VVSFIGQVTLPGGHPVQAIGVATIRPRMLAGVDVQGATSDLSSASYVRSRLDSPWPGCTGTTKLFWAAGKGLPKWDFVNAAVPPRMTPHLCWQDKATAAQLVAFLDAMPDSIPTVILTYRQEGDRKDDQRPTLVADWQAVAAAIKAHRNRRRVLLAPVFTWWWQVNRNGSNWAPLWPGDDMDLIAWDIYPTGKTNWTSPSILCALPFASAAQVRRKLLASEFGVVLDPTLTGQAAAANRAARAAWIGGMFTTLRVGRAFGASVWDTTGDQGDFRLDGSDPGVAVVRAQWGA